MNLPDTPALLRPSSTPHYRERRAFVQLSFLPVLVGPCRLAPWAREAHEKLNAVRTLYRLRSMR
jgi:hypothetical protein